MAHPDRPPTRAPIAPLAGYTVLVASDRRRHPVAGLLESVGARTVGVQAARSVARLDEAVVRHATLRCLDAPVDEVVVSSALGLRAWLAVADRYGQAGALVRRFAGARLLAQDAAAADGLRSLGFTAIFSAPGQTTEELLRHLMAQPLSGRRVVVQTGRLELAEACAALRERGAEVIEVPTFTAAPPAESYSLRRLADLVTRRQVDALALVGRPVTSHLLAQAGREDRLAGLVEALRADVLCVAAGPLSAAPLAGHPVPVRTADGPWVEELAESVLTRLPSRATRLTCAGHRLELRGHAVVLDGRLVPVQPGPLAVLRALAARPGQVLSSAAIRAAIPDWATVDDHAVEMAVSRLRLALRGAELVQTIVRRGYQLAK